MASAWTPDGTGTRAPTRPAPARVNGGSVGISSGQASISSDRADSGTTGAGPASGCTRAPSRAGSNHGTDQA